LAGNLSGGQQRKLAGTMALLPEPELLVFDELTTGIDPYSRMEVWRLIAAAAGAGAAVVAATAYLDEAERAEHVVLLHQGRVLASGSPQSITDNIPGTVEDTARLSRPDRAWRRGAHWRQWNPDAPRRAGSRIRLEDAAIVRELLAEQGAQS
jgi:ABC-2 type transport system ATP-binding protein